MWSSVALLDSFYQIIWSSSPTSIVNTAFYSPAQCINKAFILWWRERKDFWNFFIEYFKHISRCPGVNSSNAVITKWFKNRLAGVCHFISQKNIKTCLAKPDQASFYMLVLVRLFKKIFTQEFVFDIASLY